MVGEIVQKFWGVWMEMAPYLLFGFIAAGVLSVILSPEAVGRHLGGRGLLPVLKAALFGIPLPLCSCSVIPVTVSLRKHGASKGAATAFLLSTPQTGVDSIFVTLGMLGPVFAILRPIVALLTGLIGGGLVDALEREETGMQVGVCTDECCGEGRRSWWARMWRHAFVTLPRDVARPLTLGAMVAALIGAVVPENFFSTHTRSEVVQMLIMLAVGVPMYVCATASVPIAAALIYKGVSPGAALVFLIAGAATNAAGLTTLWTFIGRRATVIYLATVVVMALASGGAINMITSKLNMTNKELVECDWHMPVEIKLVCALVLAGILVAALLEPWLSYEKRKNPDR
ncbi:MAG: permease [bacterium]|nr:permease [bacterium]